MTISNMARMNFAYQNLYTNRTSASASLQKLSSRYRINSAADDASAVAISEKMRGLIGGLSMASQNAQNGVSMAQTAEGGLSSSADVLVRMKELAVQASNGTYSDADRAILNKEFNELKGSLDQISSTTNYNGTKLLDGSLGGKTGVSGLSQAGVSGITAGGAGDLTGSAKLTIAKGDNGGYSVTAQIGGQTVTNTVNASDTATTFQLDGGNTITMDFAASGIQEGIINNVAVNAGQVDVTNAITANASSSATFQIGAGGTSDKSIGISIGDMSSAGLGLSGINISTLDGSNSALKAIDDAINKVSSERGGLGAAQNRLSSAINSIETTKFNTVASESRIRDLDMAKEMMNYTQKNIQMMASQIMMAQGMNLTRQNMMAMLMTR